MTLCFVKRLARTRTMYLLPTKSSRDHADSNQPGIQGFSHGSLFLGGSCRPSPSSRRSRTSSRTSPCSAATANTAQKLRQCWTPCTCATSQPLRATSYAPVTRACSSRWGGQPPSTRPNGSWCGFRGVVTRRPDRGAPVRLHVGGPGPAQLQFDSTT